MQTSKQQPLPSPTQTAPESTIQPVLRAFAATKKEDKEEEEEEESEESETESEESSSEEEEKVAGSSTPFVEYDSEPLAKSRTQSRSMVRSVADAVDVQPPAGKIPPKSLPLLESKSPVSDRSSVASVSPLGRVSQSSSGFSPSVNTELGHLAKSPRSLVAAVPVSPVGRASQLSLVVNTEPAYSEKTHASPAVKSPVLSNEPDYAAGKTQALPAVRSSPTVHSPTGYSEPSVALKFQRSPPAVANVESTYSGKPRRLPSNSAGMPPEEVVEYTQFDSEPMQRNPHRRSIPYADDDDRRFSPAVPIPSSPRKPSSPQVQTLPAAPVIITQTGYVQTFEAPSVSVPRATAGPILMPPPSSEPMARIRASPVLRLNRNPTPVSTFSNDSESRGRVHPPSVTQVSPNPPIQTETGGDAVSDLFMKLETARYTNRPSQITVQGGDQMVPSQEASYGPGYRPSAHGAIVRSQEPYPVEVMQLCFLFVLFIVLFFFYMFVVGFFLLSFIHRLLLLCLYV